MGLIELKGVSKYYESGGERVAAPISKNISEDQKKDDIGPLEQKIKYPDPEKEAGEVGEREK